MITVQETTKWDSNTPNHRYILTDDGRFAYGYIRRGDKYPQLFSRLMQMDWRQRSYKILVRTKDVDPSFQSWKVEGSKGNSYIVSRTDNQYRCTCPAALYRHAECKHIEHVKENLVEKAGS